MVKPIKNVTKKPSKGRRKIEIKKIESKCRRQVTFTKRRSGLFRKASELCVLTDAKIAIFTASQKGKMFTFGHPNVGTIIDRYHGKGEHYNQYSHAKVEGQDLGGVRGKLQDLEAKRNQLKELNKKGVEKDEDNYGMGTNECWWREVDHTHMGLAELEQFRDLVEELRSNLTKVMIARAHDTQDFR